MKPITFDTLKDAVAAGYSHFNPICEVIEKHGVSLVRCNEVGNLNLFTEFEIRLYPDHPKFMDGFDVVAVSDQIWLRHEKNAAGKEGVFIVRFKTADIEKAKHLLD